MVTSELEILSNPWKPTITHTILQELAFTNASHGKMKIGNMDGYKEVVKKYLQVGQLHKATEKNQRIEDAIREQEQQRQANKERLGSNFLTGIRPTKKN
ncbi:12047_t:CDS:2 [Gigaspora margarita]|uniref:12047_t:CDS:1 n=1 Tax=Gigaspora margarita TaxID=4874 RepID=A0ABN7V4D4_GIGMA|nr:12047_t:CDS:2 [Gigaspora margarita]